MEGITWRVDLSALKESSKSLVAFEMSVKLFLMTVLTRHFVFYPVLSYINIPTKKPQRRATEMVS